MAPTFERFNLSSLGRVLQVALQFATQSACVGFYSMWMRQKNILSH
jgi:hypothetical protein